jgi:hypothetical protein
MDRIVLIWQPILNAARLFASPLRTAGGPTDLLGVLVELRARMRTASLP